MKLGKIKKKALLSIPLVQAYTVTVCGLCKRDIVKHQLELHHLTPKSKGGTETVPLHSICHRQIHALLTESELALDFNTLDQLAQHPDISKFLQWVQKKPIDFKERAKKSKRLKSSA